MFGRATEIVRESSRPRTILGFLGAVIGVIATAMVVLVGSLARYEAGYIAPVLIVGTALIALLLVGFFIALVKDPTRLMLGRVETRDFLAHRLLTLGDDVSGETLEHVFDALPPDVKAPALPPAETTEEVAE
jgi:hypothetical protein